MSNPKWEDFRHTVLADHFKRGMSSEEIIREYGITSRTEGKRPSRSTVYLWLKQERERMAKEKEQSSSNKSSNAPTSAEGLKTPQELADADKSESKMEDATHYSNAGVQRGQSDKNIAQIISTPPPETPTTDVTPPKPKTKNFFEDLEDINKKWNEKPDSKEYIDFDLLSSSIPDVYERALRDRGANLEAIGYDRYKAVQQRTTGAMVRKYIPMYDAWGLEINFGLSYIVPAVLAGMNINAQKQGKEKPAPPSDNNPQNKPPEQTKKDSAPSNRTVNTQDIKYEQSGSGTYVYKGNGMF